MIIEVVDMIKNQTVTDYRKEIVKIIGELGYRHSTWQVFSDFVEMSAIAISNSVDWTHKKERETRYLEIINTYEKREQILFPKLFAYLVNALEYEVAINGPSDILGGIFHELELHNKWKGQFFTPVNVCEAIGMITVGDKAQIVEEKGFLTLGEPCVGSGAMVLGFAKAMQNNKMNYCSQMVVTAQDIDLKCVHMAYIQFALYGIPAVVIHGNTLTVEEWSRWYTPIYMVDGWVWRQQCGMTTARNAEDEQIKRAMDPKYNAIRELFGYEKNVPEIAESDIKKADFVIEGEQFVIKHDDSMASDQELPKEKNRAKGKKNEQQSEDFNQLSLFDIAQ